MTAEQLINLQWHVIALDWVYEAQMWMKRHGAFDCICGRFR